MKVIARWGPNEGRYMVNCHNLVHEDHDMMIQFRVGKDVDDVNDPNCNDPVNGAKAKSYDSNNPPPSTSRRRRRRKKG